MTVLGGRSLPRYASPMLLLPPMEALPRRSLWPVLRAGCASLVVAVLLACAGCPKDRALSVANAAESGPRGEAALRTVQLLFTGSVRGTVEPCGCTAEPLGGVDKLVLQVGLARAAMPTLFLDSGDLLFDHATYAPAGLCQEKARVAVQLAALQRAGLAATAVGPLDLSLGPEFRAAQGADKAAAAMLGANVAGLQGLRTRMIQQVGQVKVGITAVTWPALTPLPAKDADTGMSWMGLMLSAPHKALAREAGLLRQEGAEVVVVLGQTSRSHLSRLLTDVAGIDLGVVGHDPGEAPAAPEEVARGSYLLAAGAQGQHLGKVTLRIPAGGQSCCLTYDDEGRAATAEAARLRRSAAQLTSHADDFAARKDPANAEARRSRAQALLVQADGLMQRARPAGQAQGASFTFEALPLGLALPGEAAATQAVKTYKESLPALNLECEKNLSCAKPPPGAPFYVGPGTCVSCHLPQYLFWISAIQKDPERMAAYSKRPDHPNPEAKLGHSRAWQTLLDSKATANRDCLACHSVGFDIAGGYCKVGDAAMFGNVSCEACHGPGSTHMVSKLPADITRAVPEERCRSCHVVPHIKSTDSFNYVDKLGLILGKGHGEERLKAVRAGK